MRAGRGREGQLAVAGRVPADVVAQGWRSHACRRRRGPFAGSSSGRPDSSASPYRRSPDACKYATARCIRAAGCGFAAAPRAASTAAPKRSATAGRVARGIDARSRTFFFSLWHQEALIMAKHRGRGVATINYPIGMNLGGDPSQALVHSNPTGKFTVALSSIDLGQGMKSVTRQICAETLGVPVEDVYVDTADSDTGPHCMGSFASRGTHRVGNAVMAAAREARGVMMEAAAEELEVNVADLETDGRGNPRQGRAASLDLHQGSRDRRAVSPGPHDFRPRHLPGAAVGGRPRDRRNVAGDLLRPRLLGRAGRGR